MEEGRARLTLTLDIQLPPLTAPSLPLEGPPSFFLILPTAVPVAPLFTVVFGLFTAVPPWLRAILPPVVVVVVVPLTHEPALGRQTAQKNA
jgi:hypothetical protein